MLIPVSSNTEKVKSAWIYQEESYTVGIELFNDNSILMTHVDSIFGTNIIPLSPKLAKLLGQINNENRN